MKARGVAAWPIWRLCWLFDLLPVYDRAERRWFRGGLGCHPLRISRLAMWIEGDW